MLLKFTRNSRTLSHWLVYMPRQNNGKRYSDYQDPVTEWQVINNWLFIVLQGFDLVQYRPDIKASDECIVIYCTCTCKCKCTSFSSCIFLLVPLFLCLLLLLFLCCFLLLFLYPSSSLSSLLLPSSSLSSILLPSLPLSLLVLSLPLSLLVPLFLLLMSLLFLGPHLSSLRCPTS